MHYFQLGIDIIAAIVVSMIIGYLLDSFFQTKPWIMIAMIPIGAVSGFRTVYNKTKNFFKEDDND